LTFFWSDTHFNHAGIITYCARPYQTTEEMDDDLVSRWNSVVGRKDTIYHLGDFAYSKGDHNLTRLFSRLNGHKHLIVGNHDEKNPKVLKLDWTSVSLLGMVKESGMRAVVCHYPLESWRGSWRGALMLHGHCHGTLKRVIPHRFDVGVEVRPYPVAFEVLWAEAVAQTFVPSDHHGDQ
jgi:calcineurin-like phosphoesterase family protein